MKNNKQTRTPEEIVENINADQASFTQEVAPTLERIHTIAGEMATMQIEKQYKQIVAEESEKLKETEETS